MNLPNFIFPAGAWFFLALIPLVVLYFLKLKRPRMEIPSLALWHSVVNDQRVNSPFQKFKRNLLLLLQLLLLLLVILALMQPFMSAGPDDTEYLPVLIDCSASMSAQVDDDGTTRLDLAKEAVRELIKNRGNRKLALFTFAFGGRRISEFTNDESLLLRALNQVEPTHRASSLAEVLRMADAYSRTARIERVVVVTDRNLRGQSDLELPFDVEFDVVGGGGPNVGITEFNARRSTSDGGNAGWDVFVRVEGSADDPVEGQLSLMMDGQLVGREDVFVSRDDSQRLVFPVAAEGPALLQVEYSSDTADSLPLDNSAWLSLPEVRPLRVRVSSDLYAWQHAFGVLPNLEIDAAATPTAPDYDVIVSDTETLQGITAPVVVFNGVLPQELTGLISMAEVEAGDPAVEVIDWVATAPLLRHVRLRDVQIAERTTYLENADEQALKKRGFEVLVHGESGPLVLQRRRGLETEFYFLFHTAKSTLPYRLAFPILASNVVDLGLQSAALADVAAYPTGVLPPLAVEADREFTIVGPDNVTDTVKSTDDGQLIGIQANYVGRYDVRDGGDTVLSVGTGILSSLESSLLEVDDLQFAELSVSTEDVTKIDSGQQLWWLLALIAFGILLVEWWYFQRQKTGVTA